MAHDEGRGLNQRTGILLVLIAFFIAQADEAGVENIVNLVLEGGDMSVEQFKREAAVAIAQFSGLLHDFTGRLC